MDIVFCILQRVPSPLTLFKFYTYFFLRFLVSWFKTRTQDTSAVPCLAGPCPSRPSPNLYPYQASYTRWLTAPEIKRDQIIKLHLCVLSLYSYTRYFSRVLWTKITGIGCVPLASSGQPCDAHLGEPLTRAYRTITRPLVVTSCTSSKWDPSTNKPLEWRQSYSNVGVDPGKLIECTQNNPLE